MSSRGRGRGRGAFRGRKKKSFHHAPDKLGRIQIDKQACNLQESNFLEFIETVAEAIIKEVKKLRITEPTRKLVVNLSLERNKINDIALGMLVECLINLHDLIEVEIIRLHMNSIRDDGIKQLCKLFEYFSITELHLSHNYITWEGFFHLYQTILQSDRYPILPHSSPFWLRLEYNQIDMVKIEKKLKEKEAKQVCIVKKRGNRKGECNIRFCAHHPKLSKATKMKLDTPMRCKLHIPYIYFQKQSLKSLCTLSVATAPTNRVAQLKQEKNTLPVPDIDIIDDDERPLLIVLDTCTIISMSQNDDFFSFDNLLKLKDDKMMDDNIRFILIDTVFQQLDARKKETRNATERISIRHFVDDILSEATKCNLIHYIHPMELEDEVRARGGHIGNQNFRKENGKFDSDGLILDCAYYLMEQSPGNVLVLTDDIPCKARALMNKLPAETLRILKKAMLQKKKRNVTRGRILRGCTEEAKRAFFNKEETPKPRGNLITELSAATELVQKLAILLKESIQTCEDKNLVALAEDSFAEAQGSIGEWSQLIEAHQHLRKITQSQPSPAVSAPLLFESPNYAFKNQIRALSNSRIEDTSTILSSDTDNIKEESNEWCSSYNSNAANLVLYFLRMQERK